MRTYLLLIPNPSGAGHCYLLHFNFFTLISRDQLRYYEQNYQDYEQKYLTKLFEVSF